MAAGQRRGSAASPLALALGLLAVAQVFGDQNQGAVFLREFTLIRRESLHDDFLSDLLNNHKTEDPELFFVRFSGSKSVITYPEEEKLKFYLSGRWSLKNF